jgi:hypothetical protein
MSQRGGAATKEGAEESVGRSFGARQIQDGNVIGLKRSKKVSYKSGLSHDIAILVCNEHLLVISEKENMILLINQLSVFFSDML